MAKAKRKTSPPKTIEAAPPALAPTPPLPPEMMALAEVLAAYMIRANIRYVIAEPSKPDNRSEQAKAQVTE